MGYSGQPIHTPMNLAHHYYHIGWVYPLVQYWCWANITLSPASVEGWLRSLGFRDFAGSAVVHLLGGTCGLVGCTMVGPRTTPSRGGGHSKPLTALGGAILLLGFLAFNGGSTVIGTTNTTVK